MSAVGVLSFPQGGFDQKCSKSPEEHNLYWAFAALRRLREPLVCLTRNAVNLQKNRTFIGLSLH
jgi:hypothetical protein